MSQNVEKAGETPPALSEMSAMWLLTCHARYDSSCFVGHRTSLLNILMPFFFSFIDYRLRTIEVGLSLCLEPLVLTS